MNPKVYLAGPITGLTYENCNDWREYAIKSLATHGIDGYSPLRGKDYLLSVGVLEASGYDEHVLSTAKGLTTRDRNDATKANVLLVNLLGAQRVSIGTMIELGWADSNRVPIVLVMESGNLHDHAMVRELAGYVVATLDSAIDITRIILRP